MKHFNEISDYSSEALNEILDLSRKVFESKKTDQILSGMNILFVFEKPSLRTKVGTEVALTKLGANVIHVDSQNVLEGKILYADGKLSEKGRESLKDTVNNISQWCDAIFARVFDHQSLMEMAQIDQIPVINALSDQHHPMQALADFLSIQSVIATDEKVKITFIGDSNNVAKSLIQMGLKLGHHMAFTGPEAYFWTEQELQMFMDLAKENNAQFSHSSDLNEIIPGSDFIYTDTFVSMGEEDQYDEKISAFLDYQVNKSLMKLASKKAYFMHCLPAHRGEEVTDEVIDSSQSLVYLQAKNRMISSMGLFTYVLSQNNSITL